MNRIKILGLAIATIMSYQSYSNNFVKLIVNNSPYFVTIQSRDAHSGTITFKKDWPRKNWQERFNVGDILCIDYLIPHEKWNSGLFIEVFNAPQKRNDNGTYEHNLGQKIGEASLIVKKDGNRGGRDVIQMDWTEWKDGKISEVKQGLSKIIVNPNHDMAVRVIIDENGFIRLTE